jgi:long-chain fatty acid transport protein
MKTRKFLAASLSLAALFGLSASASAAGFGLYEGSVRANAMGTETTADPVGPSVMYNNPAAITELEGVQVEAGATSIAPDQKIKTTSPMGADRMTYAHSRWWVIPNAYATWKAFDRASFGVGIYSRAGLGCEYPDDWPGRYNWTKVELTTYELNPNVAFKLTDTLSFGGGLRLQRMEADMYRMIASGTPFVDPDLEMHLKGDSEALAYDVGLYWQAATNIAFGVGYQSRATEHIKGDVTCAGQRVGAKCDLTTPAEIFLGASMKPNERFKVNVGTVISVWNSFDRLAIAFDKPLLGKADGLAVDKDWELTVRPQIGVEFKATDILALRAGYAYDQAPDPDAHADYMVPGSDRNLFSIGAGLDFGSWFCDLSYVYLFMPKRDIDARPAEGVFQTTFMNGDAHMMGAALGCRF